jgi:tetratricopeptide (TPR) repeat protein
MMNSYDAAVRLAGQSRFDLAEKQLQLALAKNSSHAASYALLGICLARLKRPREALAAANEGLRMAPTMPFPHYARACVHAIADNSRQAIKDVDEAINDFWGTPLIVRRWEGSDNSPPARAATATSRSPG